jgi:hypothetical protein
MATKALELAQWGSDLTVDETTGTATYSGIISAGAGYQNLPTVFTVFGRINNTEVSVANGKLAIVGRTEVIEVGIA